jgi:lambda repressor-like predicted transcriptional regulator
MGEWFEDEGVELATLLKRAGFSDVTIYGSLAATPYENAERLVAVARK